MLEMECDITELRGAEYNPRFIEPDVLKKLQESIRTLGLIKPMIARNDLLVAGHQRTKALIAMGVTKAPVFRLSQNVTTYDEVRFNQLHNGTDMDSGDEEAWLRCGIVEGFQTVASSYLEANFRAKLADVRKNICNLILSYGPWGAVVATTSGKIIHCAQYALAAYLTDTPLTVYGIPDDQEELYRSYLDRGYGQFNYEHVDKRSFIQTYAQPFRTRQTATGAVISSLVYDHVVMKWLGEQKHLRGIDFGSGQGQYAESLKKRGYNIIDVELFRRPKGRNHCIDVSAVNHMIDILCRELSTNGLFDYVVCDSVINSVNCKDAERAVMTVINALCKPGGYVFFSGRSKETVEKYGKATINTTNTRDIEFLDDHGFSGLYRNGHWFFQLFHDEEGVKRLCQLAKLDLQGKVKHISSAWQVETTKQESHTPEDVAWALDYEFNLEVSAGRSLGRGDDVKKAYFKATGVEQ